ncbi:MAG: ThuA domain-containing protein [Planctomycetota bacterium]|nr:ThuA domain-containing protein [Planctomycetota bacterium]
MIEVLLTIILWTGGTTSLEATTSPQSAESGIDETALIDLLSRHNSSDDSPPIKNHKKNNLKNNSGTSLESILVFSRTAGFRHGSIKAGQKAIRAIGEQNGFQVQVTEDPALFSESELKKHQVVVFLNTTQDVLAKPQEQLFEQWIRAGGGYVGIHAAADTEYQWSFYGHLVGAYFSGHPRVQTALIEVKNQQHPATAHLPKKWSRSDEWYNFKKFPEHVEVLAYLDTDSYEGSTMKGKHPAIWCHEIDQGRALYTVGGHTDQSFSETLFLQHLHGAIWWAAGHDEAPAAQAQQSPQKNSLQNSSPSKPDSPSSVGETR